jgi:hypothetical protein
MRFVEIPKGSENWSDFKCGFELPQRILPVVVQFQGEFNAPLQVAEIANEDTAPDYE